MYKRQVLGGAPVEEFRRIQGFFRAVRLPVTLAELGAGQVSDGELLAVGEADVYKRQLLVRLLPHGHHDPAGMRRAQRLRLRQGSLPGPRQGNRLLRRGQLIFAEIKPGRISRGEMRPGFSFFMGAVLSAAWPGTWPAGR